MPNTYLVKAISEAITRRGLEQSVVQRIVSWLDQAEGGDFAATEKEEQLQKILNKLPGYQGSPEDVPEKEAQ
jgi:hypothetical protein